jgi:hypothetical protein
MNSGRRPHKQTWEEENAKREDWPEPVQFDVGYDRPTFEFKEEPEDFFDIIDGKVSSGLKKIVHAEVTAPEWNEDWDRVHRHGQHPFLYFPDLEPLGAEKPPPSELWSEISSDDDATPGTREWWLERGRASTPPKPADYPFTDSMWRTEARKRYKHKPKKE